MKANFKDLKVKMEFEGETVSFDLRKDLGNTIRRNTADIGLDDTARLIYFSDGEIDIPDEHIDDIIKIVNKCYIVPVQQAVRDMLLKNRRLI